jgi:hypothetical protein
MCNGTGFDRGSMTYTLDDMAAAQAAVEAAEQRTENTRHNNPNRGRADLRHARLELSPIVMDLRQRGIIPTPEPTAKQRRDHALNKAFPNAQSREEVDYEGERYRQRFIKGEYGWTRWWEEVQ